MRSNTWKITLTNSILYLGPDVLEHLHNPQDLCNLAYHSLAEKGVLVIIVPNGYSVSELVQQPFSHFVFEKALKKRLPEGAYHVQHFSLRSLKAILNNAGFNNINVKPTFCFTPSFIFGFRGRIAAYNVKIADYLPPFMAAGWLMFCKKQ